MAGLTRASVTVREAAPASRAPSRSLNSLTLSFAVLSIATIVLPWLRGGEMIDRELKVVILIGWLLSAFVGRPTWPLQMAWPLYGVPVWLCIVGLYAAAGAASASGGAVMSFFAFFFAAYLYDYYKADLRSLSLLCAVTVLMFAVGSLYTIGQLVQNPTASRLVTTGKYDDLALAGIGEFRFAYAVALLLPWLLVSAVWARRTLLRLVLLLFFAVLALLVYYASFGIAVGLAIAGCLAAGFTRLSRRMPVVLGFAVFVACIAFFLVGGDILASYSRSTNNETLARKADELANVIRRTTTADMDIFKRLDLYHESWATFLNNPLLGAGARYESADALMHGITEHSAWLDTLARFGLFGGLPILILTLTLSNFAYRQWRGTHLGPFVLTMTALVAICGLVNPLLGLAEIGVVIFLVGPAIPRSFGLDLPETANRTAYTGRKNGGCPPRHSGSTL